MIGVGLAGVPLSVANIFNYFLVWLIVGGPGSFRTRSSGLICLIAA